MILDPKIARIHAILKFDHKNKVWTIEDNKSVRGIFINECQIKPKIPQILKNGNKIKLWIKMEENRQFIAFYIHLFGHSFVIWNGARFSKLSFVFDDFVSNELNPIHAKLP